MSEKVEWEVIDGPQPHAHTHARSQTPPTLQQLMKAILGRWWRWKILGVVTVASVVLVLLATVAGMFALFVVAGAAIAIAVGKVRRWIYRRQEVVPH